MSQRTINVADEVRRIAEITDPLVRRKAVQMLPYQYRKAVENRLIVAMRENQRQAHG